MTDPTSGRSPRPRPEGVTDATVAAGGKLSEAFEYVERARGHLYSFHQLMGHADLAVGEAAESLLAAMAGELAQRRRSSHTHDLALDEWLADEEGSEEQP